MAKATLVVSWTLLGAQLWGAPSSSGINPVICVFPDPPCAGDTIIIEVSGMPTGGTWTVHVRYSKGGSDAPHDVLDSDSTATQSNVPSASAGGVMNVTVSMGGDSHTESFAVRDCP